MDDARSVMKEFFELSASEKASLWSLDFEQKCALYTSNVEYDREEVHLWRDAIKHSCYPLEDCIQYWPQKPTRYRKVMGEYTTEVAALGSTLLELICQGLGLEKRYFENGLSQDPILLSYHYPPCPDPSLTLGVSKHRDPDLLSILLQDDVPGLEVFKGGRWYTVEPKLDAFVVNVGDQLQIVSNGKMRSVEHRVVTNATETRTSLAFFICPIRKCFIEPAKALVTVENPPLYRSFVYEEYFKNFKASFRVKTDHVLVENFEVKA